jgi:hypothetical protein
MKTQTVAIAALSVFQAHAATFYLAPTGVDSASRSGSSASPWKTINYAQSRMATGDDLILKAGTYTFTSTQYISKSGTGTNPMEIKAATGAAVYLDGGGITTDWTNMLYIDGWYVTFRGLEVRNNQRGAGVLIRGSYVTVDNCKAYGHGLTAIQIYGYDLTQWSNAPLGCSIINSSVWNNCLMNKPDFWNYKGWKDQGGGWPFALGAIVARDARVTNCWSSDNHGEGIVLSRVQGGVSEIRSCQARDNYSVNIYCDGVTGASNYYASIRDNIASTTFKTEFYRSGAPALSYVVSAENYDGNGVGSLATRYVQVIGNQAYDGGHNYAVLDQGKSVSDIWIDGNTALRSNWGNYKRDLTPNVYNIWLGTNSGF